MINEERQKCAIRGCGPEEPTFWLCDDHYGVWVLVSRSQGVPYWDGDARWEFICDQERGVYVWPQWV